MCGNSQTGLLILAITLSTRLFSSFAIVEDFQNAFSMLEVLWALRRQVDHGFSPWLRSRYRADQEHIFYFGQFASILLMRNKATCSEGPEQVVDKLALSVGISKYIAEVTAAIGFFNQFAGKLEACSLGI